MIEVKEPQFEPIIPEKAFGLISNNLIEKMAETNPTAQRIATIEEIAAVLTKNLIIEQIADQIDDFINFILKYINDNNETVAAISIQLLNKVLATVNLSKEFEPKKLVPLLIKKFTEKSVRIRVETTDALKHLLKIFRIRRFLELMTPYLNYPHFNIKQEIMNLIIFSFLTSKGTRAFDLPGTILALSHLLTDKHFKVRFIALEALSYITLIESHEKILKLLKDES